MGGVNLDWYARELGYESGKDLWGDVYLITRRVRKGRASGAKMSTFVIANLKGMIRTHKKKQQIQPMQLSVVCDKAETNVDEPDKSKFLCCSTKSSPFVEAIYKEYLEKIRSQLTGKALKLFNRLLKCPKKVRKKAYIDGKPVTLAMIARSMGISPVYASILLNKQIVPAIERVIRDAGIGIQG